MLVFQTRTIQWDRDATELTDAEMTSIATTMLNIPSFWTDLETGKAETYTFSHEGRRALVVFFCLSAIDDIQLQILNFQYIGGNS